MATSALGQQAILVTKGVYRDKEGRILARLDLARHDPSLRQAQESLEQTREALFRAQKMEAVGQLTVTLPTISTASAIILGNVELLRVVPAEYVDADEIINPRRAPRCTAATSPGTSSRSRAAAESPAGRRRHGPSTASCACSLDAWRADFLATEASADAGIAFVYSARSKPPF